MRKLHLLLAGLLGCFLAHHEAVFANDGAMYSGFPFGYGFYQPYGVRYSTSVRTPPYFALNPSVYYGARHHRPYGISPFAALLMVKAGDDYQSRPAVREMNREVPFAPLPPQVNPFCSQCAAHRGEGLQASNLAGRSARGMLSVEPGIEKPKGQVRINPYAVENIAEVVALPVAELKLEGESIPPGNQRH